MIEVTVEEMVDALEEYYEVDYRDVADGTANTLPFDATDLVAVRKAYEEAFGPSFIIVVYPDIG